MFLQSGAKMSYELAEAEMMLLYGPYTAAFYPGVGNTGFRSEKIIKHRRRSPKSLQASLWNMT